MEQKGMKAKRIPTGSIYKRRYRDREGRIQETSTWFIKYYIPGNPKPIRLATETESWDEAAATLRDKMAGIATLRAYSDRPERVRMNQLFDLEIEVGRLKGNASQGDLELVINNRLRPRFGAMLACRVGNKEIRQYISERLAETKRSHHKEKQSTEKRFSKATINKELACLRRAFKLGASETPPLVLHIPRIEMLDTSDNVREGILSHENYRKVRDSLSSHGRVALVIAYHTGARAGEIRQIERHRIDFKAGRINLPGFTTKTGKTRYLPMYGDMAVEIEMAISKGDSNCPFLVQCDGQQITKTGWRKNWKTACELAGVPQALFHDLRRTALTHMIEAGFSEKEAMEISGHKTRAVFERYHIVSERRLKEMTVKLDGYLKAKEASVPELKEIIN
jgi:integrase